MLNQYFFLWDQEFCTEKKKSHWPKQKDRAEEELVGGRGVGYHWEKKKERMQDNTPMGLLSNVHYLFHTRT